MSTIKTALFCAAAIPALALASPAFAEAVADDAPGGGAGAKTGAETGAETGAGAAAQSETGSDNANLIVVTARRRAETAQDVPIAMSVFNEKSLEALQASDLSDIQYSVPNLYLDQGDAGNAVIYIRGIGQNDSLAFADPGVGVYVDDVFIARSQAAFLDVFDVERIEVLRGPQGTLYGRNTIGGAVKFVSTEPTDTLEGRFEAGIGNYQRRFVNGRISGPIAGEKLKGKLAIGYQKRDGYNHNLYTGRDDGDLKTLAGRASLLFAPISDMEFRLTADFKQDRPRTSRSPVLAAPAQGVKGGVVTTFPAASDPYRVNANANGLNDRSSWGLALTSRFFVTDRLTLESITAYREFSFDLKLDTDAMPVPALDVLVRQEQNQLSQEIRANYKVPGGLDLMVGGYYFYDDDLTFSGVDNGAAVLFGLPVTAFGFPTSALADTHQETESFALFADATYPLADSIELSLGARYTWETRSSARRFEFFFDPNLSVVENTPPFLQGAGIAGQRIAGEATFKAFTPRGSLRYKINSDAMLYASASRGFKSGGFDGRANSSFGFRPFRPEYVWSYELGTKTSWADGKLILNGSLFYNDYKDLQVTSFGTDPVSGTFVSLFTNAASARAYGAELQLIAQPAPGLTINGSLGLLNSAYREFETLVAGVATDVSGRRPVNAPDFNGSLGISWTTALSDALDLTLHGDGAYRSAVATEITDNPLLGQKGYGLLNAFIALGSTNGAWEVQAGVKNITDEAYRTQGFNLSEFPGTLASFYGSPRTYELRLIVKY